MKKRSSAIVGLVLVLAAGLVWFVAYASSDGDTRPIFVPEADKFAQPAADAKPLVAPAVSAEAKEVRKSATPKALPETVASPAPEERENPAGSFQIVLCHGENCGLEWDLPGFALEVREVHMNSGQPVPKLVKSPRGAIPSRSFAIFSKPNGGYTTGPWSVVHVGSNGIVSLPNGTYEIRPAASSMLEFYRLTTWIVLVPNVDVLRAPTLRQALVRGVVIGLDGEPTQRCVVQIESSSAENTSGRSQGVISEKDGTFELLVYPGVVKLDVKKRGGAAHREVDIATFESAWVELQLQPTSVASAELAALEVRLVGAPVGQELRLAWVDALERGNHDGVWPSNHGLRTASWAQWRPVNKETTDFAGLGLGIYSVLARAADADRPGAQHELEQVTIDHDGVTRIDVLYSDIRGPRVQGRVLRGGRSSGSLTGLYPLDRPGIGPPLVVSDGESPFDLVPPTPGAYLLGVQIDKGCVWHTQPIRIDAEAVLQVDVELPSGSIRVTPTGEWTKPRPAQLVLRRLDFSVPGARYRRSRLQRRTYHFTDLPDGRYVVDLPTGVEGETKPSETIVVANGKGATISVNEIAAP